jgi:hypothetical protein
VLVNLMLAMAERHHVILLRIWNVPKKCGDGVATPLNCGPLVGLVNAVNEINRSI